MEFNLERSIQILERTPLVLKSMLTGLSDEWISTNEGNETWSAFDIVGHLIHGELTDWIPRAEVILSSSGSKNFAPFDRFAQFENSKGKSLPQLLTEFEELRRRNMLNLRAKNISEEDLQRKGIHPDFGEVSLSQLLATWVVHDLTHIAQISRVMSKQYKDAVGPWIAYLRVLQQ
jgi:hypothetical protein